ncbi:response regulator [Desulfobacterales bacterium HSG17]|nr:response regulator [Desulfobacterales bacterium HSG17]
MKMGTGYPKMIDKIIAAKRVLVVEDDEGLNKLAQKALRRSGFDVQGVSSGTEAIDLITSDTHQVLLLDQQLSDMTGIELIHFLIEHDRQVPFVVMTGQGDEKIAVEMMKLGAADYLIKSFDLSEILPEVFHQVFQKLETENRLLIAMEALRISEINLRDAQKIAQLGNWTWELKSGKVYWSDEIYNIFGIEKKIKPNSEKIRKLIIDEDLLIFDAAYKKIESGDFPESIDYRIHKNGGQIHYLSTKINAVHDAAGELISLIGTVQDVTSLKKIEEQLQQNQKIEAIGTLAGGLAHDFNNMLSIISGNASYGLSQLKQGEELFDVLLEIQEGTMQAQALTQQLLTFSKGGAPVKKLADINQLVKESARFITRGAKSRCEFNLAENLYAAEVDAGQINQVIGNLVINADQSMPNGGVIRLCTENNEIQDQNDFAIPGGHYIKITIEDQGLGIPEKHLANIFDPFFTTKQMGSGLGLATAYSIIKKHDGCISASSESEKGTVFTIYLPVSLKSVTQAEDKQEPRHTGHGKVLIMDDQESILKIVGRMLNRMGYETAFATDGFQAVDIYRQANQTNARFDLVILDLTVPGGMGGAKTVIELLKLDPNVKAVVSSGYSNDTIMADYEDYGFCGVIHKPFTKSQLADLLNKILGGKK